MKYIGKNNRLIIFLVVIIILVSCLFSLNNNSLTVKKEKNNNSFIEISNVKRIKFNDKVIVLNKMTIDIKNKILMDIDNNKDININDLYLAKDIINRKIKLNNKDLSYMKKNIKKNLSNKFDLNYDKKVDSLDINILQKYLSSVIDLDFNNDNIVNEEDINILDLYINNNHKLKILSQSKIDSSSLKFIYDKNIIDINNGIITPKKEGNTTLKVLYNNEYDTCNVVVVNLDKTEKSFSFNEKTIYLSSSYLTTVMKSTADINKDGRINALDYLTLKEIINYTFGDFDNNRLVDSKDISILNNYIKENNRKIDFIEKYDINHDGYINEKDLKLLKKYTSKIKIGDVNKDTMVEDRDINIVNEYNQSYYRTSYNIDNFILNKKIEYKINNPGIINIDENGIIYAQKDGEVTIEGMTKNNLKDTIKVVVSKNNKLPNKIKVNKSKITLKYFDYEKIDILKFDFNNDSVVDNNDLDISYNIINIKPSSKDLNKMIKYISSKKYDKKYDINNDKILDNKDISIIYFYLNNRKNGDLNNDNVLDSKDISLFKDYINSKDVIKPIVLPKDSINSIYYYSSNNNIASVDEKGIVTSNNKGTTYINLLTVNGIKEKILVEVK